MKPFPKARLAAAFFALILAPSATLLAEDKKADAPAKETLPAAKVILEKFTAAIGGKAPFEKYKSQKAIGKMSIPAQGIFGNLELYAAKPDKLLIKVNIPGIGEVLSGYNGKVGFTLNEQMGPSLLKDKALEQMKEQADFDNVLHDEKNFKSMETLEKTTFDGKDVYKLRLVKQSGDEVIEYFDIKTGYLVGMSGKQESPVGSIEVVSTLSDYKKFGDLTMASKVSQKMLGIEQVITISEVEYDKVPDSVFELPKEIKALVE